MRRWLLAAIAIAGLASLLPGDTGVTRVDSSLAAASQADKRPAVVVPALSAALPDTGSPVESAVPVPAASPPADGDDGSPQAAAETPAAASPTPNGRRDATPQAGPPVATRSTPVPPTTVPGQSGSAAPASSPGAASSAASGPAAAANQPAAGSAASGPAASTPSQPAASTPSQPASTPPAKAPTGSAAAAPTSAPATPEIKFSHRHGNNVDHAGVHMETCVSGPKSDLDAIQEAMRRFPLVAPRRVSDNLLCYDNLEFFPAMIFAKEVINRQAEREGTTPEPNKAEVIVAGWQVIYVPRMDHGGGLVTDVVCQAGRCLLRSWNNGVYDGRPVLLDGQPEVNAPTVQQSVSVPQPDGRLGRLESRATAGGTLYLFYFDPAGSLLAAVSRTGVVEYVYVDEYDQCPNGVH